jgi:hypothetical protein
MSCPGGGPGIFKIRAIPIGFQKQWQSVAARCTSYWFASHFYGKIVGFRKLASVTFQKSVGFWNQ